MIVKAWQAVIGAGGYFLLFGLYFIITLEGI